MLSFLTTLWAPRGQWLGETRAHESCVRQHTDVLSAELTMSRSNSIEEEINKDGTLCFRCLEGFMGNGRI